MPRYNRPMLRSTAMSRTQHVVLRQLADELLALLDQPAPRDETTLHDTLHRLGSAIKSHSEIEVHGMYPQLLQHPDAEVRALAETMIHRIKDVYDGYMTFQDAWTPERIRSKPETFVKQARFVHGLGRRVELRIGVRNAVHELRGDEQRALFAVQEVGEPKGNRATRRFPTRLLGQGEPV